MRNLKLDFDKLADQILTEGKESDSSIHVVSETKDEVVLQVGDKQITVVLHPSGELDYYDADGEVWTGEEKDFDAVQEFVFKNYPFEEGEVEEETTPPASEEEPGEHEE